MASSGVLLETDARGVATLTLNRPERHNAFDRDVIADLRRAFDALAADASVRALVLRANGANFCAGADLEWMRRGADHGPGENRREAAELAAMLHALYRLPVPAIARVHGAALGGGAGLVCCCDIAIAGRSAVCGFSEARLGLVPATIGPYVVRAIGLRAAGRWCLTGERFDAHAALDLGLVHEVMEDSELDHGIARIVDAVLQCGPEAVRATKRLLREVAGRPLDDELIRFTSDRIAEVRAGDEAREGLAAFLEKRAPRWPGKSRSD